MSRMAILAAFLCVGVPTASRGAPPPGTDPDSALSRWVRSLKGGPYQGLCCSLADCRPTLTRQDDAGHVQAWIGKDQYGDAAPDAWVDVPQSVIDLTTSNGEAPDSRTWVCYYGGEVHCLKFGGGT